MALLKGGNTIVKSLGKLVGLLLSLYVFDQIIAVVLPLTFNCVGGSTYYNASDTVDYCVNGVNTGGGNFTSSLVFIKNLFPVMGIIGTFEIVYGALKQSGMV